MRLISLKGWLVALTGILAACAAGEPLVAGTDGTVGSDTQPSSIPPGPQEVVFHSDWSTATGASDAALLDTDKAKPWPTKSYNAPPGNELEVVDASVEGLVGWPTANALKVIGRDAFGDGTYARSGSVRITEADNYWPEPGVGESLYFRYYLNIPPDAATGASPQPTDHPIENTDAGGTLADWSTTYQFWDDGFTIRLWSITSDWPNHRWGINPDGGSEVHLSPNTTYRLEWQIYIASASGWNLHVRLYDAAGNLLYDDDDWHNTNASLNLTDEPLLSFNNQWWNILDFGTSGLESPGVGFPFDMYRFGAVAVCANDWCGPYRDGM